MARYDVYAPIRGEGYLLEVQADILHELPTTVAVPLIFREQFNSPVSRLHPAFFVAGTEVFMLTHNVGTFEQASLGTPVTNLGHEHDRIRDALDMLLQGF